MSKKSRSLFILSVLCLGIISIVMGGVFIVEGIMKTQLLAQELKAEQVFYKIDGKDTAIDSAETAAIMSATLKTHRRAIAPTFSALLNGGKFNPTDAKQLTYGQAINMENSLNLAQMGFGLTTVVQVIGGGMIVIGLALVLLAIYLRRDGIVSHLS